MISLQVFYEGRVQGVGFRFSVRQIAKGFEVTGWVRNLPDGRVEVLACGEPASVEQFINWLWEGSPASKVAAVETSDADLAEVPPGFTSG
jgi:acylphosphatase